jgi:hypothetical protein
LTVCPACLQLFDVGVVRHGRCPNCNAEVDI